MHYHRLSLYTAIHVSTNDWRRTSCHHYLFPPPSYVSSSTRIRILPLPHPTPLFIPGLTRKRVAMETHFHQPISSCPFLCESKLVEFGNSWRTCGLYSQNVHWLCTCYLVQVIVSRLYDITCYSFKVREEFSWGAATLTSSRPLWYYLALLLLLISSIPLQSVPTSTCAFPYHEIVCLFLFPSCAPDREAQTSGVKVARAPATPADRGTRLDSYGLVSNDMPFALPYRASSCLCFV